MAIDIALLVVWGLVTWCVSGEGAFGAALNCLAIVTGGLIAMNYFEPLATFGQSYILTGSGWPFYWDTIALVGLFAASVTGLRFLFDYFTPLRFELVSLGEEIGRWFFGAFAGYATMAILLTALHTAPFPREFMGFTAERKNLFNLMAPDRQWLGFTQFVSESVFAQSTPQIFDGPVSDFIQNPGDTNRNKVWSSFPIRYATRREQYEGGAFTAPPPVASPPSGGNTPNNSGRAAGF